MNITSGKRWLTTTSLVALLLTIAPQLMAEPRPNSLNSISDKPFTYDRTVAFDLKEVSKTDAGGIAVRDIDYTSYAPKHKRVKAYLVKPQGTGPFAGIVYFHWLGEKKSDRTQFLDEAKALAHQGVVSLLIQGFFPWSEPPTNAKADRQQVIDQTIEVRRALDLLLSQKEVDPKRVAYVGHDYGAMYGSVASGFDKRVKTYVLIAAPGTFGDWSLKYWPATAAQGAELYRQTMKEVDPIQYISRAAPASLLFQFANDDKFIPKAVALEFFNAASEPKQIKWYDAKHDLEVEAARVDRDEWLIKELALGKDK